MSESLEIQERVYNKSLRSSLHNTRCETVIYKIEEIDSNRTHDLKDLETECTDIKKCLTTFTENIFSNDIQSHDIVEYKKTLVDIEKKINILKMNISKQREDLEQKEKELVDEIIALQKLISNDHTSSAKYHSARNAKVCKPIITSKCKEVEVFQSFLLKTGGHTGGWGASEHGIFLHAWTKCYGDKFEETIASQSSDKLISIIKKKLPVLADEEIEAHKMWYFKYLTLKESQSRSVEMWKALKEVNKCCKSLAERDKKENGSGSGSKVAPSDKSGALEEWRRNKENEERMLIEQKALENIQAKEELLGKYKMNKLRRQINKKWLETKKSEMEKAFQRSQEEVQQENAKKAADANKKIKEFRQRDQMLMTLKKSLMMSRNVSKFPSPTGVVVGRRPHRFLRNKYHELTDQWRRRISKNDQATKSILPSTTETLCDVDYLPKLGVPKWRQEIV